MKKYAFFKYFIKNRVFVGGGGAGRPVPIGEGFDVQFSLPIWFGHGGGGGCMEAGAGMLKPAPDLPRCHVYVVSECCI